MKHAIVELSDTDLRLVLEACRALGSRSRAMPTTGRNPVVRRVLVDGAAELDALGTRLQKTSDRIRAARFEPGPEPSPSNVRPARAAAVLECESLTCSDRDPALAPGFFFSVAIRESS